MAKEMTGRRVAVAPCAVFFIMVGGACAGESDAENVWQQALPNSAVRSVAPETRLPGMYEIVMGDKVVYGDPTGRFLVFGHIYDLKTQEDVTQARIDAVAAAHRIPWGSVPLEYSIHESLAPRDAPKVAVLFSPECGWCKRLYDDVRNGKDAEGSATLGLRHQVNMHFIIVSPAKPEWKGGRPPPGFYSYALADRIVCNEIPDVALATAMSGDFQTVYRDTPDKALVALDSDLPSRRPFPDDAKPSPRHPHGRVKEFETCNGEHALAAAREFATNHNLTGTPALISGDGRVHRGYLPPGKLLAWLNEGKESGR